MKTFHCTNCHNLVFFENVRCLKCDHALAYLPDRGLVAALEEECPGSWRTILPDSNPQNVRLCSNYTVENICNWALGADDPDALCQSCRLTQIIFDLTKDGNRMAWFRVEMVKRCMVYSLIGLELPLAKKVAAGDAGLAFQFLEDSTQGDAHRVLTGHNNKLITLNIAEADDVLREQQRTLQREPYRTLLGHFRHEIGHYY